MAYIPAIPVDWIKHSNIEVQNGCFPKCIVLRRWNEITPFVTHLAYVINGKWEYESGNYCYSRATADESFASRSKALNS